MSKNIYGIITAPDQSPEFFNFTRKHESVSKWNPNVINSNGDNDFEINVVHNYDDGVEVDPTTGIASRLSTLLTQVVDLVITKSRNSTFPLDKTLAETEFTNAFPNIGVVFDGIIPDSQNKIWPQMITVTSTQSEIAVLYLYPSKFEREYTNSNVRVIPLFKKIDDFGTTNLAGINAAISALSQLPFSDEFSNITSIMPCTSLEVRPYQWINRSNMSEDLMVPFGIVCYGNPSKETKDTAVRDFISRNTKMSKADLEVIFPTLFGSYGFTMIPYWKDVAFESDRTVYSTVVNPDTMLSLISGKLPAVSDKHIADNYENIPTVFQSIVCMAIPDADELDTIVDFRKNVPRYILASPTSGDFTTMPDGTKEFVKSFMEALDAAEKHPVISASDNVEIETIGNLIFATFFSNGLRWRILTKSTLTSF